MVQTRIRPVNIDETDPSSGWTAISPRRRWRAAPSSVWAASAAEPRHVRGRGDRRARRPASGGTGRALAAGGEARLID